MAAKHRFNLIVVLLKFFIKWIDLLGSSIRLLIKIIFLICIEFWKLILFVSFEAKRSFQYLLLSINNFICALQNLTCVVKALTILCIDIYKYTFKSVFDADFPAIIGFIPNEKGIIFSNPVQNSRLDNHDFK